MFDEEDFLNDSQRSYEPSIKKQRTIKSNLSDLSQNTRSNSSINKQSKTTNTKLPQSSNSPEFKLNSSNWIENFQPKTIDDLAVHPKKIEEVLNWFKSCESHDEKTSEKYAPMLILTGPAGSGKTATIRTIAQHLSYEISEWITPVDIELIKFHQQNTDDTFMENQIEKFSEFLFRSSRYASVLDHLNKKLILVEDFPNIFLKKSDDLCDILE